MRSDLVDISGEIRGETVNAYRFYDGLRIVWLPKSQCEWDESDNTMAMPEWLAKEKELIWMGLQETEAECAANAVAPRVSLADIESHIAARYDFTADTAIPDGAPEHESLRLLSICLLVMRNGFTLIGKSAPASSDNFNADLGRKLAYEDAIRQAWPLEGYALRDRLAGVS
jgi:hypothetical protein